MILAVKSDDTYLDENAYIYLRGTLNKKIIIFLVIISIKYIYKKIYILVLIKNTKLHK